MSGIGRPLPKFGEWDVNDPSSAEGYTVIFEKARDEKKTGGNAQGSDSPRKENKEDKSGTSTPKSISKNWLCCVRPSHAES